MNTNNSKFWHQFLGTMGLASVSLFLALPSHAELVLKTDQNMSAQTYDLSQLTTAKETGNKKSQLQLAQNRGSNPLNPRPGIFNEPPYNRRGNSSQTTPNTSPASTPTTPATEVPTTPTTETPVTTPTTTETKNIIEVANASGSFKTLLKALKAAGLTDVLQGKGPFTVFAPTDAAFAKLPQDAVQDLLKPENKEVLVKVLTYHVVTGNVRSSDLKSGQVNSLQGDPITVKIDEKGVMVNDAKVTQADIPASNGVIHQIDNVILPPSL
jgi:uncharacterized surface protein with fasciclin (FAS1) repeats